MNAKKKNNHNASINERERERMKGYRWKRERIFLDLKGNTTTKLNIISAFN